MKKHADKYSQQVQASWVGGHNPLSVTTGGTGFTSGFNYVPAVGNSTSYSASALVLNTQ